MGIVRTAVVSGILVCASLAHADCVSVLRDTSSGVFDRVAEAVAWTGTTTGIAKVDDNNSRAIDFAIYSEDLNPLTDDRRVADSSFLGVTALLWNSSEFALFDQDPSSQLMMRRIDASGEPVGSAVAITPNHPSSTQREYSVVWDATRQAYLLAQSVTSGLDKGVWLTILNRDGSLRSDELITPIIAVPTSPRIAVNDNGAIIVLFRRSTGFSVRVTDSTGVDGVILPVMNARDGRVASDGSSFVVVGNIPSSAPAEIDWAVVDDHGSIVIAQKKLFASHGVEIAPVSIAWNASRAEWALAYLDSRLPFTQAAPDYRLRRFSASGTLVSDGWFSTDLAFANVGTTQPFAWTGSSYTTAAARAASGTVVPVSFAIRLCPLTASIATPTQIVRAGDTVTFTASTDGGAGGETYSWDLGDFGPTGTGKTVARRYPRPGDYNVVMRVTDLAGATGVATLVLHVIVPKRHAAHP